MGSEADPVEIATGTYFWKPMAALFRAVELDVFRSEVEELPAPVLDLGCGEGRFASMLGQLGIVSGAVFGVDVDRAELRRARAVASHVGVSVADAGALPFASGRFGAVVANGVLMAIENGPAPALAEIRRVLRPGGCLAMTVPTPEFRSLLPVAAALGRVSLALRDRHLARLERRLRHFHVHPPEAWQAMLRDVGLEPAAPRRFFCARSARLWNGLALDAARALGISRLLGPVGKAMLAPPLHAAARRALAAEHEEAGPRGYCLMVARRPG